MSLPPRTLPKGVNLERHLQHIRRPQRVSNFPQFRQVLANSHPTLPHDDARDDGDKPISSKYEKIAKIGQGTFGEVFKVRARADNRTLALKSVRLDGRSEGLPLNLIREVKILRQTHHANIVQLIEVVQSRSQLHLVLEYCEHDLAGILANRAITFKPSESKSLAKQLLSALYYIHLYNVIHRDLKPANILVTRTGVLKLADFGLARQANPSRSLLTTCVVTLWYRAPELLLGDRHYGTAIDIWSVGCILAELWTRAAIMRGESEVKQLQACESWCGSIGADVWPSVTKLELFRTLEYSRIGGQKRRVREWLKPVVKDPLAVDLIDRMLALDPGRRISADDALSHDYLWTDPMPSADLSEKFTKISDSNYEFVGEARIRNCGTKGVGYNGFIDRVY